LKKPEVNEKYSGQDNNKKRHTSHIVKNAVFWDVTLYGSCENRCFGERSASIVRMTRIDELRMLAI
jgi:hypothetical protein